VKGFAEWSEPRLASKERTRTWGTEFFAFRGK
jgi:hypothetical protein